MNDPLFCIVFGWIAGAIPFWVSQRLFHCVSNHIPYKKLVVIHARRFGVHDGTPIRLVGSQRKTI